jgi:hypothetical protein
MSEFKVEERGLLTFVFSRQIGMVVRVRCHAGTDPSIFSRASYAQKGNKELSKEQRFARP